MSLVLYNTQSRSKEIFEPINKDKVTLYVCGPTVYDLIHIGNARAFVFFDVVCRHLRSLGYQVTYVRNITDVDDKIIQRANREGQDSTEIAKKFAAAFEDDMQALGLLKPDVSPKATDHIEKMVAMIEILITKKHAYEKNGSVYFDVSTYSSYCNLSGRNLNDLQAGARVNVDLEKRNAGDFALWKACKPQEPSWDSPWGKGRPGWHIECSVMSQAHLGDSIDIHGGGRDLVFPHHENERAQSECATGKTFVKYWLHNGFLNLGKEKMSKSVGNLATVRELLEDFHADTIRYLLLSSHYRSPIEFSKTLLEESSNGVERIYSFLKNADIDTTQIQTAKGGNVDKFVDVMNDDFNTAQALAILFEAVKEGNLLLKNSKKSEAKAIAGQVLWMGRSLGLLVGSPENFLQRRRQDSDAPEASWIEEMIEKRKQARAAKDFALADEVRKELESKNVILEDRSEGTSWRIKRD